LSSYFEKARLKICSFQTAGANFGRGQIPQKTNCKNASSARRVPMKKSKFLFKTRAFLQLWICKLPETICKWSESRTTPGLIVRPPKLRRVWKVLPTKGFTTESQSNQGGLFIEPLSLAFAKKILNLAVKRKKAG
jgi:hypothetical protein